MVHRFQRLLVVMSLLTIAGVEQSARGDDVTAERVQRLVEQLGESSRAARVEAERTLRELGPDVLSHLPAPEQLKSAASREAVLRVRDVLERQQAEVSASASRVTLVGEFTLRDLVQVLSDQTGNAVITRDVPGDILGERLDIDWHDVSFWEAMRDIELLTGLSARLNADDRQLELMSQSPNNRPRLIVDVGAFRIAANSLTRRRDFTDESREVLRVGFDVMTEPRLRPLFIRVNHSDFQLSMDDQNLTPLNANAKLERPADRGAATPLFIDFVTSKPSDIDAVTLKGRLAIELAAGEESFVFRNLDSSERVARRRGGVTVTMERAQFSSGDDAPPLSARINLRVTYESGGPAFESHRTWVFHNEAHLQSGDGAQRWSPAGFDTVAEAEAAVKLSYRFQDVEAHPSELEFVYAAPTLILTVPIEFELPDIPPDVLNFK